MRRVAFSILAIMVSGPSLAITTTDIGYRYSAALEKIMGKKEIFVFGL